MDTDSMDADSGDTRETVKNLKMVLVPDAVCDGVKRRNRQVSRMKRECHCPICGAVCGMDFSGVPSAHIREFHKEVDLSKGSAFREEWKGKIDWWEREATEEELRWKMEHAERRAHSKRERYRREKARREAAFNRAMAKERKAVLDPAHGLTIDEYVTGVRGQMEAIIAEVDNTVPEWKRADVRPEEKAFAALYITNGFHADYAYRAVFKGAKTSTGKSYKSGIGDDNTPGLFLQRPNVQKLIQHYMGAWIKVKANELNFRLVGALMHMAFYDPGEFIDIDGSPTFRRWEDIPAEKRLCIKGIKTRYYGAKADAKVQEVELADRMDAMRVISKFMVAMKEQLGNVAEKASSTVTPETELMLRSIFSEGRHVARKKGEVVVNG